MAFSGRRGRGTLDRSHLLNYGTHKFYFAFLALIYTSRTIELCSKSPEVRENGLSSYCKEPYLRISPNWNYFFERANPTYPWLTPASIELLSTLLKPTDSGLEWGAGRSTLWFSQRIKHLISVEHDPAWFSKVQKMVEASPNVDLRHKPDAESYAGVTDEFAPESLDFVLVDGELARDECAHRAIPLLRPGGLLVLDNANRYIPNMSIGPASRRPGDNSRFDAASWDRFLERVASWRHIWTDSGCSSTAIWIKP
jgi:predicted O-methyltransferase YrrM